MIELFAVGGIWFFVAVGLLVLFNVLAAIWDSNAIWILGLMFIGLMFISSAWTLAYITLNPGMVIMYIGIYLVAGLLWSIKEWYDFVIETIKKSGSYAKDYLKLDSNWSNITRWIAYWPFYFLAWLLRDPVKLLATRFTFIYQGIVNSALKKYK